MAKVTGNGTVYFDKTNNKWVGQYIIIEENTKKRKSIHGKTKEEVMRKLAGVHYQYDNGNYIRENGIPLVEILYKNRENKYNANLISDSQYQRLGYVIKSIENSEIGKMKVADISYHEVQNFLNSLVQNYSNSTIKKTADLLKQAFETAKKDKYILDNPMENIIKPRSKKETKKVEAFTVEEQGILSNYLIGRTLEEEPYRNVFLFQMYMGLRIGEVLALKQTDIDFEKQRIKIRRTLTIDKDGILKIGQRTKTYAGTRDIPMQKFLLPYILEQYNVANNNEGNYLFLSKNHLIKHTTINSRLQRILKNLGIYKKGMSSHSLRHTFGTRCIEGGMTPVALQRLMGHTDIKITLNTYTSVLNEFKESELDKISNYYEKNNFLNAPTNEKYLSNNNIER